MNHHLLTVGLAAAALVALPTVVSAADPKEGRKLARQCAVCHGKFGIAKDPETPNLAGQQVLYLEKSLKEFRDGARDDRRMTLVAEPLSDEEIAHLAAWYASIEVTVTPPK